MAPLSDPILSCAEAGDLERRLFGDDEAAAWAAMQRAGRAVAAAVRCDFREIGSFPPAARILVLVGKGHNGGDALIAAQAILEQNPGAVGDVVFVFGERALQPLAMRAWRELAEAGRDRISVTRPPRSVPTKSRKKEGREPASPRYDLCLDGVFGFRFHPPIDKRARAALRWANRLPIQLRAAVDLPSGLNEPDAFRADFTYATGIVKFPVLSCGNAGRLRYLDLGFFTSDESSAPSQVAERTSVSRQTPGLKRNAGAFRYDARILSRGILSPLTALRQPHTDKRDYGHLLVLGGSRSYPGAVLMTVLAALRSGAGLVTAFVPESLSPAYAARAPEAMWVGWPETEGGGLALKGRGLLAARIGRAAAWVMGPGLGDESETLALVSDLAKTSPIPVLLDANALQPDIVREVKVPHVLTPHAGEFARIAGRADLRKFCENTGATVVLKGPGTCIAAPSQPAYYSFFGGPVLARGGSGDILAGLIGGLLAQTPTDPMLAACRGVVWHGRSADLLAQAHGQTSVSVTQILDFLPAALHDNL